ncbi:MAG: hypothetical protein QM645_11675 [Asticcacaulis sp.]
MRAPINKNMRRGLAGKTIGPQEWIFIPAVLTLIATLIMATNLPLPWGLVLPEPVWPLALAFSWPLIRPSYIAPIVLALVGLFLDFFWGAPLGFYVLLLMIVYGITFLIRSYIVGQDMAVVVIVYLIAILGFFALGTILTTLYAGQVPRLIGVGEQILATLVTVPVMWWLLDKYLHADVRFQ